MVKHAEKTPGRPNETLSLTLETFLPYRLNRLAELVSQSLSRIYTEQYGISTPEWRVLATLGQFERMTAKNIGAHSKMHKTKVSRAVAVLEEMGMVVRDANPEDLREAFLTLSLKGRKMYREIVPEALKFDSALAEALTSQELRTLSDLVQKLTARAQMLESTGAPVSNDGIIDETL